MRVCMAPKRALRKQSLKRENDDPSAAWLRERCVLIGSLFSLAERYLWLQLCCRGVDADADVQHTFSEQQYRCRNSIISNKIARCKFPPMVCGSFGSPPSWDFASKISSDGSFSSIDRHLDSSFGFNVPHAGFRTL